MGVGQGIPWSVFARNPHKGLVREISHDTGSERGKEGPREDRSKYTVSKSEQQRPVDRTVQSGDESRVERRPVNRSQKRWLLGPVDLQMPD